MQKMSAYLFLILAQVMVGVNIVGTKSIVDTMPITFILMVRFGLAAIFLLLFHGLVDHHGAKIHRHTTKLNRRDWLYLIAQALTAGVLFNCLMVLGLRFTNANVAGIITSALPAIIAVMSWLVLKEKFSRKKSLCVGLATIGLVIISADKFSGVSGGQNSLWGDLIIILSLIPEAAYYVLSKMHTSPLPIFLRSAIINSINTLAILPFTLLTMDWHALHLSGFSWLMLVVISISSGLFFVFWYLGADNVDAVVASLSTAFMPIATVTIAWLFLKEIITPTQFFGMGLVIASIIAYALPKKGKSACPQPS